MIYDWPLLSRDPLYNRFKLGVGLRWFYRIYVSISTRMYLAVYWPLDYLILVWCWYVMIRNYCCIKFRKYYWSILWNSYEYLLNRNSHRRPFEFLLNNNYIRLYQYHQSTVRKGSYAHQPPSNMLFIYLSTHEQVNKFINK